MNRMTRSLSLVALVFAVAQPALAQHSDIEVAAIDGKLVVEPGEEGYVFEGELGETFPNFGTEPGFEAEDGQLQAGDELGFNLLAGLLYWDGGQFAAPPNAEQITISKAARATLVTPNSGAQNGFHFAAADDEGGLHEDLEFLLSRPDANPDTAIGAYGLWLELASPRYESSNGFIILLNNGLAEEQFEAGVAAAAKLVPEPASWALAALGLVVAAGTRRAWR